MTIHHLLLVELLLEVLERGHRGRVEQSDGDVVPLLAGDADDHGDPFAGIAVRDLHGEHDAVCRLGFSREGTFLAVRDLVVIARDIDVGAVGREALDVFADGEASRSAAGVSQQARVVNVVEVRGLAVEDGRDADEGRLGAGAEVADADVRGEEAVVVQLALVALAALEVDVRHQLLRVLDGQQVLGEVRVVEVLRGGAGRGRGAGRRTVRLVRAVVAGAGTAGQGQSGGQGDKRERDAVTTSVHGSHSRCFGGGLGNCSADRRKKGRLVKITCTFNILYYICDKK